MLVFVQSKERAKDLFHELIYDGLNVDVIHADRTQAQVRHSFFCFTLIKAGSISTPCMLSKYICGLSIGWIPRQRGLCQCVAPSGNQGSTMWSRASPRPKIVLLKNLDYQTILTNWALQLVISQLLLNGHSIRNVFNKFWGYFWGDFISYG